MNGGPIEGLLLSAALMCASTCAYADEISPNQGRGHGQTPNGGQG